MIIALLVALGVSLWVVLVLVGLMFFCRRWLRRPEDAGEIRRMGERPVIVELALAGGDTVALALRAEHAALALRRSAPLAG